jgi:hypothetical protein
MVSGSKLTECKLPLGASLLAKPVTQSVHAERGARHGSRVYLTVMGARSALPRRDSQCVCVYIDILRIF